MDTTEINPSPSFISDTNIINPKCDKTVLNRTKYLSNFSETNFTESRGESYFERSLGFLVIGIIGTVANLFVILILGSSLQIRQKLVNTLIIHQSFVDMLSSIALVCTAHLDGLDQHGLTGVHADIYCFFVAPKWPL